MVFAEIRWELPLLVWAFSFNYPKVNNSVSVLKESSTKFNLHFIWKNPHMTDLFLLQNKLDFFVVVVNSSWCGLQSLFRAKSGCRNFSRLGLLFSVQSISNICSLGRKQVFHRNMTGRGCSHKCSSFVIRNISAYTDMLWEQTNFLKPTLHPIHCYLAFRRGGHGELPNPTEHLAHTKLWALLVSCWGFRSRAAC